VQPAADPTRGPGTTPREVTSEREGKRRGPLARRRASRRAAEEENPLVHSFEKVKTIEAYQGGAKPMDGSDELDQHQAALDEVDLRETITSDEPTRSVYHAGLVTQGQLDEPGADAERRYDEWDHARRRYLPGYCGLREVVASGAAADAGRAWLRTIRQRDARLHEAVRATVEQVKLARRWQPRQLRGDELDIDRVVDRRVALAAGHDGTRRVYARRRRADRELAVLLLLDLSMSTDAWVEGRRVLDVERDAAAAVALGVDGLLAEVMIAGFFSNTRHDARYVHLKRADEDLAVAAARLAALEPQGYTRMGPAIRHAGARLARCAARERLLIVITDGKPSDRDRYEGRHGEADVRQAIRELAHERVHVLGIGVDPAAVRVMRAMFGARACTGLASPGAISDAIAQVLADFQR
jgi:nitric oxide reductase NorD protein